MIQSILVLFQIAFRNLFSSFLNIIIGGIIFVGTLLFVVGWSVLDNIDTSMSKSIIGSLAGNVQVYSDKSKEELTLYDTWTLPDISPLVDFSQVKTSLLAMDNVKTVIPMGINTATVNYGNTVDVILEKLRKAVNTKAPRERVESLKAHVRQIIQIIQHDFKNFTLVADKKAVDPEAVRDLQKASSNEFWNGFDSDPLGHLEFLENKIALLLPDSDFIMFSYVGTDMDSFKNSFDRMEIADGQMVPKGQRGLLMSKYIYEDQFKLKTARRLDKIYEAVKESGKKIAQDPDLQLLVKQNRTQTREIILQLDPLEAKNMASGLRSFLKSEETEMAKLFSAFFDTNDDNLADRYAYFYKEIAPTVELYRLRPGDIMTIKAFTKGGFIQASNLKVYGTFQFKGLEKSGMAGAVSLMDLMTFRDLYGFVTPEKIEETEQLKKATGTKFVDRASAESELFGGTSVVKEATQKRIDEKSELGGIRYKDTTQSLMNRVYTQDEIEKGVALNAAIILKDPAKTDQTMTAIQNLSKQSNLDLRVVSWQRAAGTIGNFVLIAKLVLYFAIAVIFTVALVIINNAVMMATLQRVREIGTMRAIGAQRGFVLSLVLVETLVLGLVFGTLGTFCGSIIVQWMGIKGIPAVNEFMYFFFSGPRLHVTLNAGSVIGAFIIISIVTTISALYPAIIATRVTPVQAMQSED